MVDGKTDPQSTEQVRTHGSKLEFNEKTFFISNKETKYFVTRVHVQVLFYSVVYKVGWFLMFSMFYLYTMQSFDPNNKYKQKQTKNNPKTI